MSASEIHVVSDETLPVICGSSNDIRTLAMCDALLCPYNKDEYGVNRFGI